MLKMLKLFVLCAVMVNAVHAEQNSENDNLFCTSTETSHCAQTKTDSKQETNRQKEHILKNPEHERTLVLLKPDAVQRKLVGKIIARFENRGLKLVAIKISKPTKRMVADHYAEHKDLDFFGSLVENMAASPIIAMVWEGPFAIKATRNMLGAHDPMISAPGTIRFDFSSDIKNNVIHGADTVDSANREINIWFQKHEIVPRD